MDSRSRRFLRTFAEAARQLGGLSSDGHGPQGTGAYLAGEFLQDVEGRLVEMLASTCESLEQAEGILLEKDLEHLVDEVRILREEYGRE